jgi:ABC-type molybdate transport system permease subunit
MFAGNMPGRTQTLPLAIFSGMERNIDEAFGHRAVIMLRISFTCSCYKNYFRTEDYVDIACKKKLEKETIPLNLL